MHRVGRRRGRGGAPSRASSRARPRARRRTQAAGHGRLAGRAGRRSPGPAAGRRRRRPPRDGASFPEGSRRPRGRAKGGRGRSRLRRRRRKLPRELRRRRTRVDRDRHAPGAPGGVEARDQLRAVGHEERDPLARLQAKALEAPRHDVDRLVQPPVARRLPKKTSAGSVREASGGLREHLVEPGVRVVEAGRNTGVVVLEPRTGGGVHGVTESGHGTFLRTAGRAGPARRHPARWPAGCSGFGIGRRAGSARRACAGRARRGQG